MNWTIRILLVVAVAWIALAPPLFTDGACTKQFDDESARLEADRKAIASSAPAHDYFSQRSIPSQVITVDQCRARKPRFLARCESGPLLVAKVPVANFVCRIYRDDEILVRLQYDERDRLARMSLDMSPYRSLPIPGTGTVLHWAR